MKDLRWHGFIVQFCEPLSWFAVTQFCDRPLCRSNLVTCGKGRHSQSQWTRGLRLCGRSPAEIMGSNPTRVHGCLSVVSVVCCQVEVSATS